LGQIGFYLSLDLGMAVHLHCNHATASDLEPYRLLQEAIPPGEVITELFPHQQAVDAEGCREDLALRKVAPATLLPVTGVAGYPAVAAREGRGQLGAEARCHLDPGRLTHDLVDAVGDLVDLFIVHRHAVEHQGPVDADHVAVPAGEVARQQLQHGHPECELARLPTADEERDRGPEAEDLLGQRARKLPGGTPDPVLHDPVDHVTTGGERLFDDCAGDVCAAPVADDCNPVVRVDVEAGPNGVAGTGGVLRQHDGRVYRGGQPEREPERKTASRALAS